MLRLICSQNLSCIVQILFFCPHIFTTVITTETDKILGLSSRPAVLKNLLNFILLLLSNLHGHGGWLSRPTRHMGLKKTYVEDRMHGPEASLHLQLVCRGAHTGYNPERAKETWLQLGGVL